MQDGTPKLRPWWHVAVIAALGALVLYGLLVALFMYGWLYSPQWTLAVAGGLFVFALVFVAIILRDPAMWYRRMFSFCLTAAVGLAALPTVSAQFEWVGTAGGRFFLEGGPAILSVMLFLLCIVFVVLDYLRSPGTLRDSIPESLDHSAQMIDTLSGQVIDVVKGQKPSPDAHEHRMLIRRIGNEIAAYHRFGVITKETLDNLPLAERDHIRVYERSLERLKKSWDGLYPKRIRHDGSIDPNIEERLKRLVKEMKTDLLAIINFLEQKGLHLDDHYEKVRAVVSSFE